MNTERLNDADIKTVWQSVQKNQFTKRRVMELLNCTSEEAVWLYDQGQKKFGRGPKLLMQVSEIKPTYKRGEFKRPPAIYSNRSPYGVASFGKER